MLLRESNALKEVVIVSTKSNGAFNKGKQVHRNNFLTESLHLFLLLDQGQLIQLPSTTLMPVVEVLWRARFKIK
jgi:hypothetical protein